MIFVFHLNISRASQLETSTVNKIDDAEQKVNPLDITAAITSTASALFLILDKTLAEGLAIRLDLTSCPTL